MEVLGTLLRTQTTAYYPATKGIVERFHCQLKASLKCYPQPDHWADFLPLELLGIKFSLKYDLGCSSAEMVYGTTLRLPGMSFASPSNQPDVDTTNYVQSLKSAMLNLQPTPPRPVNNPSFCVDPALYSQSRVHSTRSHQKTFSNHTMVLTK